MNLLVTLSIAFRRYWPLVATTMIARLPDLRPSSGDSHGGDGTTGWGSNGGGEAGDAGLAAGGPAIKVQAGGIGSRARSSGLGGKDAFSRPYGNVVRMHILIFVFAGLHAAGLSRYAIYPVLAFYFFPWKAFVRAVREPTAG